MTFIREGVPNARLFCRYGALEGHSKPGLAKVFGKETVQKWRAGLLDRPPEMTNDHLYWHGRERKYRHLDPSQIPHTESLQDTIDRVIPLWDSCIAPDLRAGRNVMIVAHCNSLRGIVKHIDEMSTDDIQKMGIPNGIPLVYKFDKNLKPIPHKNSQPPLRGIWLEKKVHGRAAGIRFPVLFPDRCVFLLFAVCCLTGIVEESTGPRSRISPRN